MSIAGGFHKAVERAEAATCDCVQVFTCPPRQWPAPARSAGRSKKKPSPPRGKGIAKEEAAQFRDSLKQLGVKHPIAHDSYLINLGSPDDALWKRSIDSIIEELRRADSLGLAGLVMHPGSHTTSSEEAGLRRIATAIDEAIARHRKSPRSSIWKPPPDRARISAGDLNTWPRSYNKSAIRSGSVSASTPVTFSPLAIR